MKVLDSTGNLPRMNTTMLSALAGVAMLTLAACGGGGSSGGGAVIPSSAPAPAPAPTSAPAPPPTPTSMQVEGAAAKCSALSGSSIPASALALPSQGATVTSAQLSPADASAGLPEFCKVLGSVIATDAADPKINFEVNLPTTWNFKALQLGGAGFNGVLITGISGPYGGVQNAPSDAKLPLAQSYVTFGSDGGTTPDGLFGTNAQAMANYSGESVKRTHDAANYLISAYYGTAPRRMYHIGGSKGGHESLQAAQKYGADYDGIVGYYPANQNQAMVLSWFRMWNAAYSVPGGALNAAKQDLVKSKVLEACDALDGVVDGIIGNTEACRATFAVNSLRCPAGADTGDTCLSDAQINTLMTGATPLEFAFPLSNGVTSIGPYPVLEAGDMMGILFDPYTTTGQYSLYYLSADPVIRTFIQQDPNSVTLGFDYRNWQSRVQQLSALLDATNPNLDAFKDRGGKFLLIQGTTDMLVSPYMTTAYYNRVVSRYGDSTGTFLRYYVQPGFGHGSGAFALKWDSLAAIDSWVESGQAPVDPVVKDGNAANGGRTRPLCEYPLFPKYKGSGDVNSASSFTCASA